MNIKPEIIQGNLFCDHRGNIAHVNDFKLEDVCRFYVIEHPDTSTVRAWQGHRIEHKYFYVVQGAFVVAWVKIDHWDSPSKNLIAEHIVLSANDSKVISIPAGYANGLKALEPNSKIVVFSDFDVQKSVEEKIRFDSSLWFDWNKIQK